jgi:hypothetical protein
VEEGTHGWRRASMHGRVRTLEGRLARSRGERTRALRGIIRDPGHARMGETRMLEKGHAQEPQGA